MAPSHYLIGILCLLSCLSLANTVPRLERNFEMQFAYVDSWLMSVGMNPNWDPYGTKAFIESQTYPRKSHFKREAKFLLEVCNFQPSQCRTNGDDLKNTMIILKYMQRDPNISSALRTFGLDSELRLMSICMQDLDYFEEIHQFNYDFNYLHDVSSPEDLSYAQVKDILQSGSSGSMDLGLDRIQVYYDFVALRMSNLLIESFPIDGLHGQKARRIYALYLVRGKLKQMTTDLRGFFNTRPEPARSLLEALKRRFTPTLVRSERRFWYLYVDRLVRTEIASPDIIQRMGMATARPKGIQKAFHDILKSTCMDADPGVRDWFELAALNKRGETLVGPKLEILAVMCYEILRRI